MKLLTSLILILVICEVVARQFMFKPQLQRFLRDLQTTKNIHENYELSKTLPLLQRELPEVFTTHRDQIFKSGACFQDFEKFLSNRKLLFQLFDSYGKPGAGAELGNFNWFGSYEECISLQDTKYCSMRNLRLLNGSIPISLYGMCVPESCTEDDVTQILNQTATILNGKAKQNVLTIGGEGFSPLFMPLPSKCYNRNRPYTTGAIVMIVLSSILLALCFVGTALEEYKQHRKMEEIPYTYVIEVRNGEAGQEIDQQTANDSYSSNEKEPFIVSFLLCFSLIKNIKAVLETKVPDGSITSINGIRTLSIFWVVLGHVLIQTLTAYDNGVVLLSKWITRFSFQAILNAVVSVDTFFLLSGLLVGYLSFKRYESKGRLPLARYYVHRYIRLTTSYAFLIFFTTYVLPFMNYGPNWVEEADKGCTKYWWTNLLYINNLYPNKDFQGPGCYVVSWYLANDMQFYVISPLIMWIMYKFRIIGVLVTSVVLIFEYLLANGLLIDLKNASPLFYTGRKIPDPNTLNYSKYIYEKPYARIAPYLIGLILGYILFYKKKIGYGSLKIWLYLLGWLVAVGIGLAVVYGPYTVTTHVWSFAENESYGLLFRIAWAIAVAWVIYACHNGYGSVINDFLSWKGWIPLSRLTYGTYLIHWYVLLFYVQSMQVPFHLTEINLSFIFIAVTFISYVLSFVVAVVIEYPVFNVEKLFFKY